jgi:hypothetical protein
MRHDVHSRRNVIQGRKGVLVRIHVDCLSCGQSYDSNVRFGYEVKVFEFPKCGACGCDHPDMVIQRVLKTPLRDKE